MTAIIASLLCSAGYAAMIRRSMRNGRCFDGDAAPYPRVTWQDRMWDAARELERETGR